MALAVHHGCAMRLASLVTFAPLLLAACTDHGSAQHHENIQLTTARETFTTSMPAGYSFVSQRECECTEDVTRAMRANVIEGKLNTVFYVDNGTAVPFNFWPETIEGVFDQIQDAYDTDAFMINVQFDTELGFPRFVYIDYQEAVADEELALQISQVVPRAR